MKKVFAMGLLVLGVCASAGAKIKVKKPVSTNDDVINCIGGITSCGTSYMYCGDANGMDPADGAAVWDMMDQLACPQSN